MWRQLRELGPDLLEREPDSLGKDNERDPAQHRSRITALARARAF
jgi:hypothetical protein